MIKKSYTFTCDFCNTKQTATNMNDLNYNRFHPFDHEDTDNVDLCNECQQEICYDYFGETSYYEENKPNVIIQEAIDFNNRSENHKKIYKLICDIGNKNARK